MQSKRQILREIGAITDKLDKITRTALALGGELYAIDPDNALFVGDYIEAKALGEMRRIARAKPTIRQNPDRVADVVLARRQPWYVRLWAYLTAPRVWRWQQSHPVSASPAATAMAQFAAAGAPDRGQGPAGAPERPDRGQGPVGAPERPDRGQGPVGAPERPGTATTIPAGAPERPDDCVTCRELRPEFQEAVNLLIDYRRARLSTKSLGRWRGKVFVLVDRIERQALRLIPESV